MEASEETPEGESRGSIYSVQTEASKAVSRGRIQGPEVLQVETSHCKAAKKWR
jgi:hypothetical protein